MNSVIDYVNKSLLFKIKFFIILLNESSLSVSINEYIHMLKHLPIDIILYVNHLDFDIIVQNYSDNNSTDSNNNQATILSNSLMFNLPVHS